MWLEDSKDKLDQWRSEQFAEIHEARRRLWGQTDYEQLLDYLKYEAQLGGYYTPGEAGGFAPPLIQITEVIVEMPTEVPDGPDPDTDPVD